MPLPLPNLDDRTYRDLVDEARTFISAYAPTWTNHNPSDPGIALIELFAWLAEILLYRINQVPDAHMLTFLKLLNGPDWQLAPDGSLAEAIRASVNALRQRDRAVTTSDWEGLAVEAAPLTIARTKCVPRRYLNAGTEAERLAPRPEHISVIIVPCSNERDAQPSPQLCQTVWSYLEPRRLLTSRHHVVGPVYVPVSAEILLARRADQPEQALRQEIVSALEGFLNPPLSKPNSQGWPFGRPIYVSELYELLENIAGVDYVPEITLFSHSQPNAPRCVPAAELWHEEGDLIGLDMADHHLPLAQFDPARIVIAANYVQVHVTIRLLAVAGSEAREVRRAIKRAVRRLFHPLYDAQAWKTMQREISLAAIHTAVIELPEVGQRAGVDVELTGDPTALNQAEFGSVNGVRIKQQQLADLQITVEFHKPETR